MIRSPTTLNQLYFWLVFIAQDESLHMLFETVKPLRLVYECSYLKPILIRLCLINSFSLVHSFYVPTFIVDSLMVKRNPKRLVVG
jgi:hypothetical protein